MRTFPLLLIPPAIESIKNEFPPLPPFPVQEAFTETAPTKPDKLDLFFDILKRDKAALLILLLPIFLILSKVGFLVLLGVPLLFFLTYSIARQIKDNYETHLRNNYHDEVFKYQQRLLIYEERQEAYQQKAKQRTKEYERQVEESQSLEKVKQYRMNKLKAILATTYPPDGENSEAKKGRSESYFEKYLNDYFPNKIKTRKTLTLPDYAEHPYSPDFVYFDLRCNLYIDIEIDEPYVYDNHNPIHYLGKDTNRNEFFLSRKWLVIRFAEEQVVRSPESCCKFIAETIAELLNDNSIMSNFRTMSDLNSIPIWSEEEAIRMAEENYRDTYL